MEKFRLILKKIFDAVTTVFKAAIILSDLGGIICMMLLAWIYKDNEEEQVKAGLSGLIIGTILWFLFWGYLIANR